jgi:hypothetical protein
MSKKIIDFFLALSLALANGTDASPLVVRCTATKPWGKNDTLHIQIDIALPEELDQFVFVVSEDGSPVDILDGAPVGMGSIEITERVGLASESHRHKFIVMRMPDDGNRLLVGYYAGDAYVNVLRADLDQRFMHFNTFLNEVITGRCE